MLINKPLHLEEMAGDIAPPPAAPTDTPPADVPPSDPPPDAPPSSPETAPPTEPKSYFDLGSLPENWRDELAGDNKDAANLLSRVSDMKTLVKNYVEAQNKIRSGEISSGLPENPTEEQLANWRVANGVPESVDGYEAQLDEGLVLGENDAEILKGVYEIAHANNIPASAMSAITNEVLKARVQEQEAYIQQDGIDTQMTTRALKDAWGQDYQTNINLAKSLVSQLPEAVRDGFMGARMPDGKGVFNSPEVLIYFADLARQLNPSATVLPNSNNPVADIASEIKALESRMSEDWDGWHKDKAAQDRLMALYDAQEKMGG